MKSFLFAVATLFAAISPASAQDVAVTAADNGGAVSVASGSTMTLSLPSQGGVPYQWLILSEISPQLDPVDTQTVATNPGMPGGPKNVVWTLQAGEPGTVELTAGYVPFTGEQTPTKTVTVTVTVTP